MRVVKPDIVFQFQLKKFNKRLDMISGKFESIITKLFKKLSESVE